MHAMLSFVFLCLLCFRLVILLVYVFIVYLYPCAAHCVYSNTWNEMQQIIILSISCTQTSKYSRKNHWSCHVVTPHVTQSYDSYRHHIKHIIQQFLCAVTTSSWWGLRAAAHLVNNAVKRTGDGREQRGWTAPRKTVAELWNHTPREWRWAHTLAQRRPFTTTV